jgi:hypothetical protein
MKVDKGHLMWNLLNVKYKTCEESNSPRHLYFDDKHIGLSQKVISLSHSVHTLIQHGDMEQYTHPP